MKWICIVAVFVTIALTGCSDKSKEASPTTNMSVDGSATKAKDSVTNAADPLTPTTVQGTDLSFSKGDVVPKPVTIPIDVPPVSPPAPNSPGRPAGTPGIK